ncbi:MAG: rRNA maturation RNase YbeY [Acidobacteria bacterium]|nr:rRNA maturation RNase YbeY [Acidobacteriota bacterium]
MNFSDEPHPTGSFPYPAAPPAAEHSLAGAPCLIRRQRRVSADWPEIEQFLGRISSEFTCSSYTVCLISDRAMRRYNGRFRKKNEATDVLSFPMGCGAGRENEYLGDILISVETAQRNASRLGLRLEDEIKALILHGLLHLRGQDHESDSGQMARSERHWGARLGLPQTLLGRKRSAQSSAPVSLRSRSRSRSRHGQLR